MNINVEKMRPYKMAGIRLMQMAYNLLYPKAKEQGDGIKVLFSVGYMNGYYCIRKNNEKVTEEFLIALKNEMTELIKLDVELINSEYEEKEYGFAGAIKEVVLDKYESGFVIWFPTKDAGDLNVSSKLFKTLENNIAWSEMIRISDINALNNAIAKGNIRDVILMQEANMEARIAGIAYEIAKRSGVKFVMIAGPSSSGKTTFANRLSIQLRGMGIMPYPIGLDDYYLNNEDAPLDEDGKKDYESVNSLDIQRFNEDMLSLLAGKETKLPIFDFKQGRRSDMTKTIMLEENDVLIIEGITALNDQLSNTLPEDSKYKIYISALNTLGLGDYEPVSTADMRLLRRMVRDARVRNTPASGTLERWPSVRRGEHKNIFPFQDEADVMFNSALIYEMAVMRLYAHPHLYTITEDDPGYTKAHRLLKMLDKVLPMPTEDIPNNSLMREFIGGSCFGV